MTKLTTEITIDELQYRIHAHENDLTQMWTADYFLSVQKELLALKQAAKNPVAWVATDSEDFPEYNSHNEFSADCGAGTPLYSAPVLPKQPEPVAFEIIKEAWRLMDGQDPKTADWHFAASAYINAYHDTMPAQPEPENKIAQIKRQKALAWLKRVAYENPCMKEVKTCIEVLSAPAQPALVESLKKVMNSWFAVEPKLAYQPEFTDVMMLLDAEAPPAQPAIPGQLTQRMAEEKALSLGAVLYDEEADVFADGWNACRAEMLKAQPDREQIRREHAEWSDATFGNVGPVGPLKHLSKEALEAAADPDDLLEWADMQFLLWDAQRRMGIPDDFITIAMAEKLEINKKRQWPEPKDGEPRLHINTQSAQPVMAEQWRSFVTDADIAALHRFVECCDDPESGGHDLEKEQVQRLEQIGALQRSGRISYITDFGDYLISATAPINAQPVSEPYKSAANDIIAERQRQISAEGWTPERDDSYSCGELAGAAACYARYTNARGWVFPTNPTDYQSAGEPFDWPWDAEWWKPTNPRRDLVKAGALILAEIERLDRAAPAQEQK